MLGDISFVKISELDDKKDGKKEGLHRPESSDFDLRQNFGLVGFSDGSSLTSPRPEASSPMRLRMMVVMMMIKKMMMVFRMMLTLAACVSSTKRKIVIRRRCIAGHHLSLNHII